MLFVGNRRLIVRAFFECYIVCSPEKGRVEKFGG